MRLIVTEKNNSAKKIAEILSGGTAKEGASFKTPYYEWSDENGVDQMTIGLKGHVLNPAFPESYNNWQETNPRDLIDADLIKEPTDKNVVRALKKVAADADDLVIATDYDREGELIGLEALQEIVEANPDLATAEGVHEDGTPVKRARYSALTKDEIERAFNELDELSMPLANAGAARQDMDLIWGATLTRSVSMATRRFGSNFLSVGRVQSPTLGLIVQRELERRAHEPVPFWEVTASFAPPRRQLRRRAHDRQVLGGEGGQGGGRQLQDPRHGQGDHGAEEHPQAADPAQHHRLHDRRVQPPRHHALAGDADRRGPLHGRLHLLSAHRQHRLPEVARHQGAGQAAGRGGRLQGRGVPARRARAGGDPRQEGDHRPPADLSDPGRQPGAPRGALGGPSQGLRAGRPPLPRHLLAADDQRGDPRQHRDRARVRYRQE